MQARQFVTARSGDPRLDPRMVPDHLGVSLNLAFERTGQGVAARILAARMDHTRHMLLRCPERSVLDVALSCGFRRRTAPP